MRSLLWLAVLAGGCSKTDPLYCTPEHHLNDDPATCGAGIVDAPVAIDGAHDGAADLCLTASVTRWSVCVPMPAGNIILPGSIDTDHDTGCLPAQPSGWKASGQPDACFFVGKAITMTTDTNVIGARPLVLVAESTIEISNRLDVSSVGKLGPGGGQGIKCGPGTAGGASGTNNTVGGGGGGGSYGTQGGLGGTGNGGSAGAGNDGNVIAPMALAGGCSGTLGGGPNAGPPGKGGGAVLLTAGTSITIDGSINASGSGAGAGVGTDAATHASGGSGGGSGGMIVLVTPAILGNGSMFANGGGGACGGDAGNMQGAAGTSPTDATTTATGCATGGGGHGGNGFAVGDATMGAPGASTKGGGGGGGGAGFLSSASDFGTLTVSPTRTNLP